MKPEANSSYLNVLNFGLSLSFLVSYDHFVGYLYFQKISQLCLWTHKQVLQIIACPYESFLPNVCISILTHYKISLMIRYLRIIYQKFEVFSHTAQPITAPLKIFSIHVILIAYSKSKTLK